jgi:hypothetical protein
MDPPEAKRAKYTNDAPVQLLAPPITSTSPPLADRAASPSTSADLALPILILNNSAPPRTLRLVNRSCAASAHQVELHAIREIQTETRSWLTKRNGAAVRINGDTEQCSERGMFFVCGFRRMSNSSVELPPLTEDWYVAAMEKSLSRFAADEYRRSREALADGSMCEAHTIERIKHLTRYITDMENGVLTFTERLGGILMLRPQLFIDFEEKNGSIFAALPRQAFDDLDLAFMLKSKEDPEDEDPSCSIMSRWNW